MYDQFYGLQGRPFQLTPDPHYYFESATHRKALSYLGYGLAQGEGFIVITGDIGAGKTTLVGHLMQTIDSARLTAVKIVSTQVEGDDMLRLAAHSFGLNADGLPKAAILHQVEGFLHMQARAGRRSLLIVDEAQNLPVSAIEELRMLSNFQLGGQSLLQIFLLGQPEFRDLIRSPELEQLRQRVIATHHLEPMMANEVEPYLLHRLAVAGWTGNPSFTPGAFAALYAATGGVPRRLNGLASRVLLLGAIEQLHEIDEDVVDAVVADMGLDADVAPEREADPVEQPLVENVVDDARIEEEAVELDAVWAQSEPLRDEAEAVPTVEVTEPDEVRVEDGEVSQDAQPDTSDVLASFARPTFAAFAPPRPVAFEAKSDPVENAPAAPTEQDEAPEVEAESNAFAEPALVAGAEPFAMDAPDIEVLRADMLGEIEALRAEIASLRAVQSHVPFGQPTQQEVDPEALRSCFTLIEERLSALEFRAEEQDTALRRVLTLLVDWVEREEHMAELQAGVAA